MNRIFRTVWSAVREALVVVNEKTTPHMGGKPSGGVADRRGSAAGGAGTHPATPTAIPRFTPLFVPRSVTLSVAAALSTLTALTGFATDASAEAAPIIGDLIDVGETDLLFQDLQDTTANTLGIRGTLRFVQKGTAGHAAGIESLSDLSVTLGAGAELVLTRMTHVVAGQWGTSGAAGDVVSNLTVEGKGGTLTLSAVAGTTEELNYNLPDGSKHLVMGDPDDGYGNMGAYARAVSAGDDRAGRRSAGRRPG